MSFKRKFEEFFRKAGKTESEHQIDEYRVKFSKAPLGRWSTASGTFSSVMDQVWEFHENGTGRYTDYGAFGGEQGETLFEWRELADLTIEFRVTQWAELDLDDEDEDDAEDEDEGPMNWISIRYDFKVVQHDAGSEVGMYDTRQEEGGAEYVGFWMSLAPLAYSGPVT